MATRAQIETIEARAYDDVAREMASEGLELSYEQADAIGDDGIAWLEQRLGLRCTETDVGVECTPRQEDVTPSKYTTIEVAAAQYVDHDDCLTAAAEDYASEHPEAAGYDLDARWADDEREVILLDVPSVAL